MKTKFLKCFFSLFWSITLLTFFSGDIFAIGISPTDSLLNSSFEIKPNEPLKKSLTFTPNKTGYYTVTLVDNKANKKRIGSIQITSDCGNCLEVEISKKNGFINNNLKYDFYAASGYNYNIDLEFKEASNYSVNVNSLYIGEYNNYQIAFNAPVEPSVKTEAMLLGDSLKSSSSVSNKVGYRYLYWPNSNLKVYVAFDFSSVLSTFKNSICSTINTENNCKIKITNHIIDSASKWTEKTSLNFTKTDNFYEAHIRVLVTDKLPASVDGKSKIGTDSLLDMTKPSMWLSTESVSDQNNITTILHEFGHALGLGHEHVNPSIVLDEALVYSYCDNIGFSRELCDTNMFLYDDLKYISFTEYDPYSVMGYNIPTSLVIDKSKCFDSVYCNGLNKKLSEIDLKAMQQAYPLKPLNSTYNVECTTEKTSWSGKSKSCDTGMICSNAPKYYGFSNTTLSYYSKTSKGDCSIKENNLISQNLGGNTQIYGQICYRAWATSPGGIFSANARGWAKCTINASLLPVN